MHIVSSFETKEQMKSWDIKHLPSTGWVAIIFLKVLSKIWHDHISVTCPAERLHFICGQSRVRVQLRQRFCSA